MFAPARRGWDGEEKDTLINIRDTEEFVVNIVSESFADKWLCVPPTSTRMWMNLRSQD